MKEEKHPQEIDSVPDLVSRITGQWRVREEEAVALQRQQEAKLKAAIQDEKEITKKLKMAHSLAAKMEKEFSNIEAEVETKKREQIEKNSIMEDDVKSGRITLREFSKKGKNNQKISEEVIRKTTDELEHSLKAIRAKNLEILQLEKSLCASQNLIRNLIIQPARILQRVIEDCKEITDNELGLFLQDAYGDAESLKLAEHKLLLTEGKSLSVGHSWNGKIEEINRVIFDPILPYELITKLKTELKKHEGKDSIINVVYSLRSRDVDVTSFPRNFKKDMVVSLEDLK